MLRSLLLVYLLLSCSFAYAAHDFDFSKGSDVRLYEAFSEAGESYYKRVSTAYREECESGNADVILAIERCLFINNFLYSEDFYFESAEEDHESAKLYLTEEFGHTPEARLHILSGYYGDEFLEKVDEFAAVANGWSAKLQSKYFLLIAERSQWDRESSEAIEPASKAYRLDANPASAKLYANLLIGLDRDDEALVALNSVQFTNETVWAQKEVMNLYFSIEETEPGLLIYERIKDEEELYFSQEDLADVLAMQGDIVRAREVLQEVEILEWNRESTLLARLKFEIEHGDIDGAISAYNSYREIGWSVDPFGRKWLEIALSFKEVPWSVLPVLSVLASFVALLLFATFPFVFVVPVHYWSLCRQASGKVVKWSYGPWGLRTVVMVTGFILVGDFVLSWWESEWSLRDLFGFETSIITEEPTLSLLTYVNVSLLISLGVLTFALFRSRSFSFLGLGSFSFRRSIGVVVLALVGFRILSSMHLAILPELRFSVSENLTTTMMRDLFAEYGFIGLWLHVGLLGPLIEEVLFRGILLGALSRKIPFWAANLIQALLFTAIHEEYRLALFYVVFGLVCGWIVKRSGSMGSSIILHAVNNTLVCLGLWALWSR